MLSFSRIALKKVMKTVFILSLSLLIVNCSVNSEEWEMRHDREFEIGNLNLALDYINNSISLDSLNHRTFFKRGLVYKELKEDARAILDFEKQ